MTQLAIAVTLLAVAHIFSSMTQGRLRRRIDSIEEQLERIEAAASHLYIPSTDLPKSKHRTMWD